MMILQERWAKQKRLRIQHSRCTQSLAEGRRSQVVLIRKPLPCKALRHHAKPRIPLEWARQDSNLQPRDYESPALPLSYGPSHYRTVLRHGIDSFNNCEESFLLQPAQLTIFCDRTQQLSLQSISFQETGSIK